MRLLAVEDDRLLNHTLCYNLSASGYTVDAAVTKTAASNFCETQDYDLVVLDVNLPEGIFRGRSRLYVFYIFALQVDFEKSCGL